MLASLKAGRNDAGLAWARVQIRRECRERRAEQRGKVALDAVGKIQTFVPPRAALIVYRLGQEILNLQSGVRFPVGAPISEGERFGQTDVRQTRPSSRTPRQVRGVVVFIV